MPLQFIEETSGNAYIRFMVRDDEWLMSSPTGMIACEMGSSPVVVDIENIVLMRAIIWHTEHRVIINKNSTIVFN